MHFERSGRAQGVPARALLLSVVAAWCCSAPAVCAAAAVRAGALQEPVAPQTLSLVLGISVEGNRAYSSNQILGALGQAVGEPLDGERLRRGVQTLWESFRVIADIEQRDVTAVSYTHLTLPTKA